MNVSRKTIGALACAALLVCVPAGPADAKKKKQRLPGAFEGNVSGSFQRAEFSHSWTGEARFVRKPGSSTVWVTQGGTIWATFTDNEKGCSTSRVYPIGPSHAAILFIDAKKKGRLGKRWHINYDIVGTGPGTVVSTSCRSGFGSELPPWIGTGSEYPRTPKSGVLGGSFKDPDTLVSWSFELRPRRK